VRGRFKKYVLGQGIFWQEEHVLIKQSNHSNQLSAINTQQVHSISNKAINMQSTHPYSKPFSASVHNPISAHLTVIFQTRVSGVLVVRPNFRARSKSLTICQKISVAFRSRLREAMKLLNQMNQWALCPAALLPELQPAPCFLSAIIGQID